MSEARPETTTLRPFDSATTNQTLHDFRSPLGTIFDRSRKLLAILPHDEQQRLEPQIQRVNDAIDLGTIAAQTDGTIKFQGPGFSDLNKCTDPDELENVAREIGFPVSHIASRGHFQMIKREMALFLASKKAKSLGIAELEQVVSSGKFESQDQAESYMKKIVDVLGAEFGAFSDNLPVGGALLQRPEIAEKVQALRETLAFSDSLLNEVWSFINFPLLTPNEISAGKKPFSVAELLQWGVRLHLYSTDPYLALNARVDPPQLNLTTHPIVKKVIFNFCQNAAKFCETTVSINATQEGKNVLIVVSDDGRGMSDDFQRNKLFQQGAQEEGAPASTGLGMWMSKNAIEKLGGVIGVDSKLREGTAFFILLPGDGQTNLTESDVTPEIREKVRGYRITTWFGDIESQLE